MKTINWKKPGKRGFSLVELMVVIVIIAVLAALLLASIAAALRFAKRTKAHVELKNLETALNKFYMEYRKWPDTSPEMPYEKIKVAGAIARMLEGDDTRGNTKRFTFMAFQTHNAAGDPVNPWAKPDSPSDNDYYYFKLDHNYDNTIDGTGDPMDPPENSIRRQVIVWTWNADKQIIIGSWDD